MQEVNFPLRVVFSKRGRARYISHLDTMRTMTRALRRSGLPIWYTQGFNPHLYLTFALPLALGVESLCEPVDLRLTEEMNLEEVGARIAACLPPGFEVVGAAPPVMKVAEIAWAEYDVELEFPPEEREAMAFALGDLFAKPAIEVMKRGKKGEKLVDIRPHAQLLEAAVGGRGLEMKLRLAAGTTLNISPSLLLGAFAEATRPPDAAHILRTRIRNQSFEDFA